MLRYVFKRILQIIPVLLITAILIFTLMYFVPGDPVQIMMGDFQVSPEQMNEIRERLGLLDPFPVQLWNFLKDLVRLDFGTSYLRGSDVSASLLERFPRTLTLASFGLLLIAIIGIPLGIICALNAGKIVDRITMVLTLLLNSMPGFWLALLLILLFAVKLKVLPTKWSKTQWYSYILPIVSCSIGSIASVCRITRASMLDVIRSDYVTTARSKGLSERKITFSHALPNALIPVVTSLGHYFGFMLGGTMVVEAVYSIPGVGSYMVDGINGRDYPIVRGCIVYLAFTHAVVTLLVDILYAFIDPRIKAQYVRKKREKEKITAKAAA